MVIQISLFATQSISISISISMSPPQQTPPLLLPKPPRPSPEAAAAWPDLLAGVYSAGLRVVAAHSRHFLFLAISLLLPVSTILIFFLPFSSNPRTNPQTLLFLSSEPTRPLPIPLFSAAAAAAAILLYLAAAGAVAGSVHAGFFGRPVKLLPTLISLPSALFRLLLTAVVAAAPFALLALLLIFLPIPKSFFLLLAAIFFSLLVFLNWSLAGSIAVVESTCGFGPLCRSYHLISGMRSAALCLFLFFAAGIAVSLWGFGLGGETEQSNFALVVTEAVLGSGIVTALLLYGLVMNVVLYMFCKALHGELAEEIYDEFADVYVCLPFDDGKAPHVVSVVQP